jgi:hypothetical protein
MVQLSGLKKLFSGDEPGVMPERNSRGRQDELEQTRRDLLLAHLELMKELEQKEPDQSAAQPERVFPEPLSPTALPAADIKSEISPTTASPTLQAEAVRRPIPADPSTDNLATAPDSPLSIEGISKNILREIVAEDMARRQHP